jgi:DNA-binding NarL/FixJ family response regulator
LAARERLNPDLAMPDETPSPAASAGAAPTRPITVSFVEDNRGTRDTLLALLERAPSLKCLASYSTGEAALEGIPGLKPDVALVDINLPGIDGIELITKLKLKVQPLQVLVLTSYEESHLIFNALRAGASGYLLKKMIPTELIPAIELVHSGGAPMSIQIARQVVNYFHAAARTASDVEKLSKREQEVLALLAKGFLYKEISGQLGISVTTVRSHLRQIYEKLHVQTRTEATAKFLGQK